MTKSFKTFLKHTAKDYHNQSVNPPVVRASTIIFKSMQDIRKMQDKAKKDPTGGHFDYGRQGTSTTHILSQILKEMEECYHVFLTPTGFGSVFLAIFSIVRPGDEIIIGTKKHLVKTKINLKDLNIITNDRNDFEKEIFVKVRSTGRLIKAKIDINDTNANVNLLEEEHGIAPGQACVFYSKNNNGYKVLGGGWIKS